MSVDRNKWPVMVQIGLVGVPNRDTAWAFFWGSIAIAVGCVGYGFVNPYAFLGGVFIFAACWYYFAIRWVDDHGDWRQRCGMGRIGWVALVAAVMLLAAAIIVTTIVTTRAKARGARYRDRAVAMSELKMLYGHLHAAATQNAGKYPDVPPGPALTVQYIYLGRGGSYTTMYESVLAYQEPRWFHEEGMIVLLGSGSVQWVNMPAAQAVLEELQSGMNPPPSFEDHHPPRRPLH